MTDNKNSRGSGPATAGVRAFAFAVALATSALLAFAVVTKGMELKSKGVLFSDFGLGHATLLFELVVIAIVLIFHRRWIVWTGVALMFAAFSGYTFYHVMHEGSCGCFGAFTPPSEVMVGIDLAVVLGAICVACLLRAPRAIMAAAVVLGLVALIGGNYFSYTRSSEYTTRKYGDTAPDRLLASEMGAELRASSSGGPAYLVFIHEIGCHVCEQYLPDMELSQAELDAAQDPTLRVRVWSKDEAYEQAEIEDYAWDGTPYTFLVIDGQAAVFPDGTPMQWMGEDTPMTVTLIEDLRAMLEADAMYPMFN